MKGNDRLNPSLFHPRYVHLTHLRNATLNTINQLTANKKDLLLVDFGCGDMPYRTVIEPHVGKYLGVDLEMNPKAEHHIEILSESAGIISQLTAIDVAETAKLLGAGRDKKEDEIDLGVGVELKVKRGQKVNKGTLLAVLHANNLKHIEKALKLIQSAFIIGDKVPQNPPLIREVIS